MLNLKDYHTFYDDFIESSKVHEYTSLSKSDIENNDENLIENNDIYGFHDKFKKLLIQLSFLIIALLLVLLIFSKNDDISLASSQYSITNIDNVNKCSINNIFSDIFKITLFTLIIIFLILIILGFSILSPIEGSIFSCCQSMGLVTSGSICSSIQSIIMANLHLVPLYSFLSSILVGSLYKIIDCV